MRCLAEELSRFKVEDSLLRNGSIGPDQTAPGCDAVPDGDVS